MHVIVEAKAARLGQVSGPFQGRLPRRPRWCRYLGHQCTGWRTGPIGPAPLATNVVSGCMSSLPPCCSNYSDSSVPHDSSLCYIALANTPSAVRFLTDAMALSAYDLFTFKVRPRLSVVLASAVIAALFIVVAQFSLPDRPPGLQTASTYAAALDAEGIGTSYERQWLLEPAGVQRSFEEPDYSLLSARPPHEIGCDISLEGENKGKLAFIGIFSSSLNGRGRRDL